MCQERIVLIWIVFWKTIFYSNISAKYAHTSQQIADILPKGSLTRDTWNEWMILFGILFLSFSTTAHFQSLTHLFRLRIKRQREAGYSLDEDSKFGGASSKSIPEGKSVRAGYSATPEELAIDLCSGKDAIRCQSRGESRPDIG